jgi:small conductance mechanosensitive channel
MGNEVLQSLLDLFARFGTRIMGSLAIVAIGLFLARRVGRVFGRAISKTQIDDTTGRLIGNLLYYLLAAVVTLIAINNLGVEISAILAALGAAGLAVGLALTGALTNLAAGIIIAILRPFGIGDHVSVDDAEGEVVDMDAFNTTLVTFDNETIIVPNADVIGGLVINYSTREFVRVEIPLVVSVEADVAEVEAKLFQAASECARVIPEPPPEVQIARFGEDGIELQLEVTVAPKDREDVIFDVNRALAAYYGQGGFRAPVKLVRVQNSGAGSA